MELVRAECAIREAFCIDPYSFLKEKVEEEGLFDYEIANLLKVSSAWIGKLRKALGLSNSRKFLRRFEQRYGQGSVRIFKEIIEEPENSLSDVVRHFGFTREYARHAYEKIYGRPYTLHHQKKLIQRKKNKDYQKMLRSKRMSSFMNIQQKLRALGLVSQVIKRGRSYIMAVNGHKIAIKLSMRPIKINGKPYYHFTNVGCVTIDCDFFICICKRKTQSFHFVIPGKAMPKSTLSIKDPTDPEPGKYLQYLEAWDLLASRA